MTRLEHTIHTLDQIYGVCASLEKKARDHGETKTSNMMAGACLMALLAKHHVERNQSIEMIDEYYIIRTFSTMLDIHFNDRNLKFYI